MSREAPLHFYSRAEHVAWLRAALAGRRLTADPEFRTEMDLSISHWEKLASPREARYAATWRAILAASGDEGARMLMRLDVLGVTARESLPEGAVPTDQALRVSLRIKAEEQAEDGLATYVRQIQDRSA